MNKNLFYFFIILFFCLSILNCPDQKSDSDSDDDSNGVTGYEYDADKNVQVRAIIDVNGDGILNNGDYLATDTVAINGDQTVSFNYPGNFSLITQNSGSITVGILNGDTNYSNKQFYAKTIDDLGANNLEIPGFSSSSYFVLLNEGSTYYYYGGYNKTIRTFIDVNSDGILNANDYIANSIVTINGNTLVELDISVFSEIAQDSGTITINITNADGDHIGKMIYVRTIDGKKYNSVSITGNSVSRILQKDSVNYIFYPGGQGVSCFIDVNGNSIMDAGDYAASSAINVNGNMIETYDYPGDFTLVTADSGTVTVNISGVSGHNGVNFIIDDALEFTSNSKIINSNDISLILVED